jgi:hypothetical protein
MLIAAQVFYLSLKIDDIVRNIGIEIHYTIRPSILIVIGLTLIGAGIMLLSEEAEYTLAKLLAASGLIVTISGIGMGLELVARRYYMGHPNIVVVPIYVAPTVSKAISINITMFGSLILLSLGILPAATFVVTEYERMVFEAAARASVARSRPSALSAGEVASAAGVSVAITARASRHRCWASSGHERSWRRSGFPDGAMKKA